VTTLPNAAPSLTSTPVTTATVGVAYSYDVNASDPDAGDTIAFSLVTSPAGMSIDGTTGVISWTPAAAQVPSQNVTVRATDQGGLFASQSFTVTVAAVSDLIFQDSFESGTFSAGSAAVGADASVTAAVAMGGTRGVAVDIVSWSLGPKYWPTRRRSTSRATARGSTSTRTASRSTTAPRNWSMAARSATAEVARSSSARTV
jgi:hypothetical protein